jgi:hypothetical protein
VDFENSANEGFGEIIDKSVVLRKEALFDICNFLLTVDF